MNENPKFRVSSAGLIDYPFLGSIKVTGLTFQEIRNKITSLLDRDYIINPQVLVSPEEFNKQSITIIGAVVKGGLIDIRPDRKYTIIEAIALAGGFTQSANQKKIYLTRDGITQKFNIDQLKDTKDPKKIFYVRPGDTITIGESLL
jgi:protein involved in polysaccharide export with SLBB domain